MAAADGLDWPHLGVSEAPGKIQRTATDSDPQRPTSGQSNSAPHGAFFHGKEKCYQNKF